MKRTRKKLISLLLSMSMMPAVMPMHNVGAEATNLFLEDFEGYTTGRVSVSSSKAYDSAGKEISGAVVTVVGDDYFEIVEENGNKYLKLYTKKNNSTTRTRIRFKFGKSFNEGTKEISYKYKSVAHAAAFMRMGNVYYDETDSANKVLYRIMSQGDNVISKLGTVIFGWNSDLVAANFANGFGTVTQTMNYGSDTDNYTITLKHDKATRTKTFTVADHTTKAARGIAWDFSSSDSGGANGKDTAIDEYGVYAFDDIAVKDISLGLLSTSVANNSDIQTNEPFVLNFDENVTVPEVTVKCNGVALATEKYTVSASGTKVSIIPVNGWENDASYEVTIGKVTGESGLSWAGATYSLTGDAPVVDSSLYLENFEAYATGRVSVDGGKVYDSAGKQISGAIATVVGDDYFEIAEENGNKYLKVYTKPNSTTTRTRIQFEFGKTFSEGTKEISYKYKSVAHAASFLRYGIIYTDKANPSFNDIYRFMSQGDNIIYNKVNTQIFGYNSELSATKYTKGFGNVVQTINYGSDADNYTLSVTNDAKTYTKSFTVANLGTKAGRGICWDFSSNTINVNGKDAAIDGYGVYAFDDIKVSELALELVSSNVGDGDTISVNDEIELSFSEQIADNAADFISITENDKVMSTDEYSVTLSEDKKKITISPQSGSWSYECDYELNVGELEGLSVGAFEGTQIRFKTGALQKIVLSDDFTQAGAELGEKRVGPATVNVGNIQVELQSGDSIEYAYDDVTNQYGFKLRKGDSEGSLKFDYIFPQICRNGKYRVKVSERIANHSKAHNRWPALLSDSETEPEIGRAIYGAGYWLGKTGIYNGTDRFGVSWAEKDNSRWISGYSAGKNNIIWGELTCGLGYKYGTYNSEKDKYEYSVEPATTAGALKGVRLIVTEAGDTPNYSTGYIKGSAVDSDTVNNPNNEDISWIYGVTVERMFLETVSASFEENAEAFPVDGELKISMTERLEENSVNTDNVVLLQEGTYVDSSAYSVGVSEDKKSILINVEGGLDYDTDYTINLTRAVKAEDKPVGGLSFDVSYTLHTEQYDSVVVPEIVSSTISDGADDVSYRTESVILTTNDVLLDEQTITKENIRLYKNNTLVDSYSVSAEGKYSVKITFKGLDKNSDYRIIAEGLKSGGANSVEMTNTFVLDFATVGDVYVKDIALNTTEQTNKFDFTATIYNNSDSEQSYQPFVAIKSKEGRFINVYMAQASSVSAQGNETISVPNVNFDLKNASCELYIWKDMKEIIPVTDKMNINGIKVGKTVIFSPDTNIVLFNGEAVAEETSVYKNGDNFVIPSSLATKYIVDTDKDMTIDDIRAMGWGVYVSDEYNFVAIGDNVNFNAGSARETVKKFGIYVSEDGSDENEGYCSSPVKSIARAVEIYESGTKQPVYIHSGEYRVSQTINLTSKSDGITIKDFGDGEVIVSGAVELPSSDFTAVSDSTVLEKIPSSARSYVKQISLADYIEGEMESYPQYRAQYASTAYYELFADGVAQTIARWPNSGFEKISLVIGDSFMASTDKIKLWKSAENGMIAGYFKYNWAFENIYIDKENSSSWTLALKKDPEYGIERGQRYYAMNMLEELDIAGEYYIDNNSKILYYYPTSSFGNVNPQLSVMKDTLLSVSKANNVKITGITFENTRGKGIVTSGGKNISVDGCVLRNIGNNAVSLSSSDSEVVNSHIYSIGGPCVIATAGSNESLKNGNIKVSNNTIHNFGRIFRTYQGAIHLNGCGNIAEYNTIYDAPHCAIRFSGSKHKISNNEVYNVVQEASDSGAVYAGRSWTAWGNTISDNYFHDIVDNTGDDMKVSAVYIDDLLSGAVVENNVIADSECAVLFGGGRGNILRNNTIVECSIGLQYDSRGEDYSAGQVKPDSDSSSDNMFETFVKFIGTDSVKNTMAQRREEFNGFGTLVDDVNTYLSDNTYSQMGYPKNAIITGNRFYGSKVTNSSYFAVENRVKEYGTYSDNTTSKTIPQYTLPDCGARK